MNPLAAARLAQGLTVSWMLVEGGAAVAAGIAARSIALTAFGVDSAIEVFSSVVVLHRLLRRTALEERGSATAGERRASRWAGYALYGLILYIVLAAAAGLRFRARPDPSAPGIVLTTVSVLFMTGLWRWRLRLADRLGSPALRADAACSMVCLYLAAVTLVGLLLNQLYGLWWADALAGLALVWWIRGEAAEAVEAGRNPG